MQTQIRQLRESDDRSSFDCGVDSMSEWIRHVASQHQKKNLSRTYVAAVSSAPRTIAGYYALAATAVETQGMPAARLPRSVSAVLLARLAVDRRHQGQRLGEYLLMHALDVVLTTAESVGVQCVLVDALDENAAGFYRKYGFEPFTDAPRRLFLPVATIKQA
ncbi:GNAT family N-acetyltransferase [Paraburkholderia sp. J11-2]|uniref:GNAT family N-acetyltransferase n=1 Tax=Paraburkholderia sp. J11-2 TaxID=2805431 RepID=UPI002AB70B49|nr:GNAT family N-acetyltransferase [Paraburkholderia sp. J11-2]